MPIIEEMEVAAVKIGMLPTAELVSEVAAMIEKDVCRRRYSIR
jgi:hydroxymethylpyrimidine/phosphomethylpyrimidine kinase